MKRFMLIVAIMFLVAFSAQAQIVTQASCLVHCDVSGSPLTIAQTQDLEVFGATAGTEVALVPDGAQAFLDPGNSTYLTAVLDAGSVPGMFELVGDPNASVVVSFALPKTLFADGVQGAVHVAYNGTSACWVDPNSGEVHYFDPTLPATFRLGLDPGTATEIELGGIFSVEPNSGAADYTGDAICTVAYAAN